MTFRATAYPKGKPNGGQEHAAESGDRLKRGRSGVCKLSVHGETGTVEPKFPRDETHVRQTLHNMTMLKCHVGRWDMKRRQKETLWRKRPL
jgi:hypothetical protein